MDLLDDESPQPGPGNVPEFTVSEISGAIKRTLEGRFGRVRVRGEIGRVFRARSGHLYYDVKDDRNVLACTTWKGQITGLGVAPEEGLEVFVTGRLSAFGAQSKYNLNVEAMEVAGAGALMAMLEKRKTALAAEGLFAQERKRALPYLPQVIGVITSPSGAVIRDILHRLRDRFPRHVLIWPVAVQGQACAPEVSRAIKGFNALSAVGPIPRPDLLIVARGGGSLEDLWGFNEESVVRAAAASEIPVISAVGHETDTTLIDHAADRRAPTPTAAAEMAVPVRLDLLAALRTLEGRLDTGVQGIVRTKTQRLGDLARGLPRPESLLAPYRQRVDLASERLPMAAGRSLAHRKLALSRLEGRLGSEALRGRLGLERKRLSGLGARLNAAPGQVLRRARVDLERQTARLAPATLLRITLHVRGQLNTLAQRLVSGGSARLRTDRQRLESMNRLMQSLGYTATLARGYAVVRGDGAVVTSAQHARDAAELELEFRDGRYSLKDVPGKSKRSKPQRDGPAGQGTLF